jgi:hypothetical protein
MSLIAVYPERSTMPQRYFEDPPYPEGTRVITTPFGHMGHVHEVKRTYRCPSYTIRVDPEENHFSEFIYCQGYEVRRAGTDGYFVGDPVILNENCRGLEGYGGQIEEFVEPHFFMVQIPEIAYPISLTPGHFA